jgi:hypothetical protein
MIRAYLARGSSRLQRVRERVVRAGGRAVSHCTGDVRCARNRSPQGLLLSPPYSRAAFAKKAG